MMSSALAVEYQATMSEADDPAHLEVASMGTVTAEPLDDWSLLLDAWRQLDVPEGWKAEITERGILMSPFPSGLHNDIDKIVNRLLTRELSDEWGVYHMQGIQVSEPKRLYMPDVIVVAETKRRIDGYLFAAEDVALAVEITSPSNAGYDRAEKRDAYAAGGVGMYLLVDRCSTPKSCTLYSDPKDGVYVRGVTAPFGDPVRLPAPLDLTIDTGKFG